jgi:alpha/beta superfamily hydrolase
VTDPIVVDDTVALEARWDIPEDPGRVTVFCHPHPMQRGTMTAPLMNAVTGHLVAAGFAVLRFNFRGVGGSTGTHGHGIDEMDDVAAAVDHAQGTYPDLQFGLCGWSFGAATALGWQARDGSTAPYAGISPPVRSDRSPELPPPDQLVPARRRFVIGYRDQFCTVDEIREDAGAIGADVEVLPGSDHFFYFREERVAEAVVEGLTGES